MKKALVCGDENLLESSWEDFISIRDDILEQRQEVIYTRDGWIDNTEGNLRDLEYRLESGGFSMNDFRDLQNLYDSIKEKIAIIEERLVCISDEKKRLKEEQKKREEEKKRMLAEEAERRELLLTDKKLVYARTFKEAYPHIEKCIRDCLPMEIGEVKITNCGILTRTEKYTFILHYYEEEEQFDTFFFMDKEE
jgi:predicted  nucleic acid-binding Zn-ribbon protein